MPGYANSISLTGVVFGFASRQIVEERKAGNVDIYLVLPATTRESGGEIGGHREGGVVPGWPGLEEVNAKAAEHGGLGLLRRCTLGGIRIEREQNGDGACPDAGKLPTGGRIHPCHAPSLSPASRAAAKSSSAGIRAASARAASQSMETGITFGGVISAAAARPA